MKKLTITGMFIWVSIFIFSFTHIGKTILNDPKNIGIAITTLIFIVIGIILMAFGLFYGNWDEQ